MDWHSASVGPSFVSGGKRWTSHGGHVGISTPHRMPRGLRRRSRMGAISLNGSAGEGGGQILRTALTLSLITGKPFTIRRIRANRDKPGLRPQHLAAVLAAADLGGAEVTGASVGSKTLSFKPGAVIARDMSIDIGTAGATGLVLQTLHLPLAMRAASGIRLVIEGGTFNTAAPSYPFLDQTWARHMDRLGLPVALAMPGAGFYPVGGGRLEAWIEGGQPCATVLDRRGPVVAIRGEAGVCGLDPTIAARMVARVESRLADRGIEADLKVVEWQGGSPGTAISLTANHGETAATFVGLGERRKSAEAVADGAVDELLAFLDVPDAAVDPHSADQLLLPLAFAEGRSILSVSEVTEHLRTNVATLGAFLDRPISILDADEGHPARVIVG